MSPIATHLDVEFECDEPVRVSRFWRKVDGSFVVEPAYSLQSTADVEGNELRFVPRKNR